MDPRGQAPGFPLTQPAPSSRRVGRRRTWQDYLVRPFAAALTLWCFVCAEARALPALVIDASTGAVLYAEDAALPWYPASLTKMMTAYVALKAMRDQKISLDTPLMVSPRAAMMPPSKMGFRPGTLVTLDNALKMLMVKSANDIAVTIAEGVAGSVEAFAEDMNEAAYTLGLRQSHFVNPNGLPHPQHVSSARDMAIIARALYLEFPEQAALFSIGALRLGDNVIRNHNNLLGRYPGADGMKTGFTCAAGFNVTASASQGGRKVIVVVLGAPTVESRTIKAAALFDRAFAGIDRPSVSVTSLETPVASPPDMRSSACLNRGKAIAAFHADTERLIAPLTGTPQQQASSTMEQAYSAGVLDQAVPMALRISMVPPPAFDPLPVQIGAPSSYVGPIAAARPPHSPVGTEPPTAARAYASVPETSFVQGGAPLAPDADALPLRGRSKPVSTPAKKNPVKAQGSARPSKIIVTGKVAPRKKAAPAPTAKVAEAASAPAKSSGGKSQAPAKSKPAAKPEKH